VFTQALHVRAESRLQTAAALRRAVADEQLRVVYQPVVSLRDGTIKGIEALVRWEHPERGLLGPGDFIEVAEDTGLIVGVGLWVLQQACCQLTEWNAAVPNLDVNIAVNLSARQLVEPSLPQRVAETIESCGLEPRRLVLEITESALVRDVTTAAMVLHALKELGVILAIDDFGTGFSSLNYLKRFPVDVLKIDRSFVNGLGVDPEDGAIVAAVRALGGALGLDVVAEGVETELQAAKLLELDCPYAQGYLFGRPVPAAALLPSLLRSSRASTLVGAAGTTGATEEGLGPLGGG
jgi:EAL domain-containing protein (putative c-di-GMP-specific phosphodiesterase class I)